MLVIDIDDAELLADIGKLSRRLSPAGQRLYLYGPARAWLQHRIETRFDHEGDEVTGRWKPLRRTTAMIRAAKGYPAQRPINVRSGGMYRWIQTSRVGGTNPTLTMPGTRGSDILRSKLKVAQVGGFPTAWKGKRTLGPSRPAPPRPVLGLGGRDRTELLTRLERWVTTGGLS